MLTTIHQAGATEAAGFLFLALFALVCAAAVGLFLWAVALQAQDYLAKRRYRQARDRNRKLARDLRNSQPHGNVRRAA